MLDFNIFALVVLAALILILFAAVKVVPQERSDGRAIRCRDDRRRRDFA
jgi:hypothetical protein